MLDATSPEGLPFGAQLVGRRYRDYRLLRFAERLEREGFAAGAPAGGAA